MMGDSQYALLEWISLLVGIVTIMLYEVHVSYQSHRFPHLVARITHAHVRAEWAKCMINTRGNEILAVQTLRNSVMSATITGSTAALALMGIVSFVSEKLPESLNIRDCDVFLLSLTPWHVVLVLLVLVLFSAFLFSLMAARFYNHCGYMITIFPLERREQFSRSAVLYIMRAGNYHSRSIRAFLWMAPLATGLLSPWLLAIAALLLLRILIWFDRMPVSIPFEGNIDSQ